MLTHRLVLITGAALALAVMPAAAFAATAHGRYTTIDVPGATATIAGYVNDFGVVAGSYSGRSGHGHGFTDQRGVFTKFSVPGATSTAVTGINDLGVMAGSYTDARAYPTGSPAAAGCSPHSATRTRAPPPGRAPSPGGSTTWA